MDMKEMIKAQFVLSRFAKGKGKDDGFLKLPGWEFYIQDTFNN
jgi:hypothetical protein